MLFMISTTKFGSCLFFSNWEILGVPFRFPYTTADYNNAFSLTFLVNVKMWRTNEVSFFPTVTYQKCNHYSPSAKGSALSCLFFIRIEISNSSNFQILHLDGWSVLSNIISIFYRNKIYWMYIQFNTYEHLISEKLLQCSSALPWIRQCSKRQSFHIWDKNHNMLFININKQWRITPSCILLRWCFNVFCRYKLRTIYQ